MSRGNGGDIKIVCGEGEMVGEKTPPIKPKYKGAPVHFIPRLSREEAIKKVCGIAKAEVPVSSTRACDDKLNARDLLDTPEFIRLPQFPHMKYGAPDGFDDGYLSKVSIENLPYKVSIKTDAAHDWTGWSTAGDAHRYCRKCGLEQILSDGESIWNCKYKQPCKDELFDSPPSCKR